ncbi:MAG TPA: RluA family pseudouridine synthase [Kofleriaceae bacterium]|nr:RluA family pseudouridine synthase [Kofleriaceae bacterium]
MSDRACVTVAGVAPHTRLVDYVKAHLAVVPINEVGPLIAAGAVSIDGRVGRIADAIASGAVVSIDRTAIPSTALAPAPMSFAVPYEDEDLLVVDKPAGMHVHPIGPFRTDTVVNALLTHAGARSDQPWAAWRPHPAHRLDRATRGLVAIAKSAAIHDAMRELFAANRVRRRYRAVVDGLVAQDLGTIDGPLARDPGRPYRRAVVAGGAPAITHYRVVSRDRDRTLVELDLETGRTHQIRAHLASIGHPIVGDRLYATGDEATSAIELCAFELAVPHPRGGAPIVVRTAP